MEGKTRVDRLLSYLYIYRWVPRDSMALGADIYERFVIKVDFEEAENEEVRALSLSEPLSSKCFVFDRQTVLILPHPPISALDSHTHFADGKDPKTQGHQKNSRILAVCTNLSHNFKNREKE